MTNGETGCDTQQVQNVSRDVLKTSGENNGGEGQKSSEGNKRCSGRVIAGVNVPEGQTLHASTLTDTRPNKRGDAPGRKAGEEV